MTEENTFVCEYCNKKFSTLFNLSKHKKTATYCIEIQKTKFNKDVSVLSFICDHCSLSFNNKYSHQAHLNVCKVKKENERIIQLEKELQEKNTEIADLKQQIREKDLYIQNTPRITNIYQNTTYEINFQTVFEKLIPFTEENIKQRILSILPRHLIEYNNYNLVLNFCSNFARKITDMVILTDKARGLVFIKNKDGEREKHQVKGFISRCLVSSKEECIQLLNSTRSLLEIYSVREEILPEDEAKCYGDMILLREYFRSETMDKTIKLISSLLTDNCVYITKNVPQTI